MHDEALMIQWNRRGDSDAFRTIIQRYGNMVFATALRVLGNPADAEDVAQDCFEKLARTHKTPRGYLGPWLHRMAVNRALDRVRSESARKRRETAYERNKPSTTDLEWDDIYPLVDEAIDRLPEKLRRALVAHYLEGLTHDAIAQRESVTRAAITQRIQRALEQMRTSLQRKGVAVPGAAILADTLGSRLAEAAVLPISLTEKLGRIALAGPVVGKTGAAVGIATIAKVVVGVLAALVIAVGGIGLMSYQEPKSNSTADLKTAAAGMQSNASDESPAESELPPNQSPALVEAVTAALATSDGELGASITGRVFDEQTRDGIVGAEILCRGDGGDRLTVTTDEFGRYAFSAVTAGTAYLLCVKADGYYLGLERDNPEILGTGRRVEVRADRRYDGVDFALNHGETYTAKVVDPTGHPVSGSLVTARTVIRNSRVTNTAVSNQNGEFTVSGFPSTQDLYVWAEKGDSVTGTYGPYSLPQVSAAADALTLHPQSIVRGFVVDEAGNPLPGLKVVPEFSLHEANREIEAVSDSQGRFELTGMFADTVLMRVCRDVQIVNMPIPKLVLSSGEVVESVELVCSVGHLEIAGTIVDRSGNAIRGARISCRGNGLNLDTRSDGEGRFRIEELPPGYYAIAAEHNQHLSVVQNDVAAGWSEVRLVMPDAVTVSGRVIDAASGQPVTNAEVKACYGPEYMRLDHGYESVNGDDGAFSLMVTRWGEVRIAARAKGHRLGFADIKVDESMVPVKSLEIRLKPQADLSGHVYNEKGKPVAGALIFAGIPERPLSDDFAAGVTARDGSFTLAAQKLAHDQITVMHSEYPRLVFDLSSGHLAGQPVEVQLSAGATLECSVLENGNPVKAYVSAISADFDGRNPEFHNAQTKEDGYCILRGLAPGPYRVTATLPSEMQMATGAQLETKIALEAGGTTSFVFPFNSGNSALSTTIVGAADSLRLDLSVLGGDGTQRYHVFRDRGVEPGTVLDVPNLPSGLGQLRLSWSAQDGGHEFEREFMLADNAVTELTLNLDAVAAAGRSTEIVE